MNDLDGWKHVPNISFLRVAWFNFCCCKQRQIARYKQMLDRAESHLTRETDLRLFVRRQRFLVMGVLGLLSKRQRTFLARSSQLVLSTDSSSVQNGRVLWA